MGIREEMTADVDAQAPAKAMEAVARKRAPKADPTVHNHGTGKCEEHWLDEDNRRRTRPAQGRVPTYVFNCKACQTADTKRMAAPPTLSSDEDFENTVFMIPENASDAKVVSLYLKQRYPGKELFCIDTIRPTRLALRPGSQVVLLVRRPLPGKSKVGNMFKLGEDKEGLITELPVPLEEHLPEVYESAPVLVSDCVVSAAATMMEDATVDISELKNRLGELAAPRNYIAAYQRVIGSDEVVFTLRSL